LKKYKVFALARAEMLRASWNTKVPRNKIARARQKVIVIHKRHIRHILNALTMEGKEIIAKEYEAFIKLDVPILKV